ncbi:hypothetical protein L207DRAFT_592480 [Hyaloscypha variabilis F]|uniref:Uncharacterized protein n=1 Tax=Hyaloscypha variabilis (strain UAMH 11265 / GT02V1 / F) TaxID=1149755 RepID=A0A2J6QVS3_HYAVF|nr:hypothetical protein L207DRAFT_592480 [Hyaloscypha variabilis F]
MPNYKPKEFSYTTCRKNKNADTISLLMGLGSISLAILTIIVTFVARKPARYEDIEMQRLTPP